MKKLLYFSASWCSPCKAMKPIVAELEAAGLSVERIDVGEAQPIVEEYKILALPTFVVLVDGKETAREMGAMPKARLEALIASA